MSDTGKDLVRRHFEEVFNGRRLELCDELHAQDYVEHAVAPFGREEPGHVNGPEHMRGVVEWLTAQFPDVQMTIEASSRRGTRSPRAFSPRVRTSAR